MPKPLFKEIRLGKTSAEKESLEFPAFLTEGFFDPDTFIETAKKPGYFLFLGHKGSGKSAIGEHLRLTAKDQPNFFVQYLSLGDFPYTSFAKIIKGDFEPEAKFPDAWSWLLLLQIIEQLGRDNGSSLQNSSEGIDAYRELCQAGLIPTTSLKHTVQQTTKNTGGIDWKLLKLGREATQVAGSPSEIPFLVERLKQIVFGIRSDSQHMLVIDGVDELLGKRSVQVESLSSLVYEIDRLNRQFHENGCPIKILLLCRTDIYEVLPNANKNKIRQDSAIELIWYSDSRQPSELKLVQLANHRASAFANERIDLFAEYFPETINVGREFIDTRLFLLEFTRHTPRDFITLLNYIQREVSGDRYVSTAEIERGVKAYSINYFLPEIRDELSGYVTPEAIQDLIAVLSGLGRREFTIAQLVACADGFNKKLEVDLHKALAHLFECSAVGMSETTDGYSWFTVKYRNRNAILDFGKKLVLHKGLTKALNLR